MNSEIYSLTMQAIEGTLSTEDFRRLEAYLSMDTAYREAYVETVMLFSTMKKPGFVLYPAVDEVEDVCSFGSETWQAMARHEETAPSIEREKHLAKESPVVPTSNASAAAARKWGLSAYVAMISTAALIFLLLLVQIAPQRLSRQTVAQLNRTYNAEWVIANGTVEEGDYLFAGPMKLTKGTAEILFEGGAQVIFEGPAVFELEDQNRVYLTSGSVVANITNSTVKRFVIRTPNASVVDYGTEFGVAVDGSGNTITHVFQGMVEMRQGPDLLKFENAMRLGADEGGIADRHGRLSVANVQNHDFIREEQLNDRILAAKGSSYHRWKVYNFKLNSDPFLVAHYTFENPGDHPQKLVNSSYVEGTPDGILGSDWFSTPEWTDGRWPQKGALRFDRSQNQAVRIPACPSLNFTGNITLAVWIKTDLWGGNLISCKNDEEINAVNYTLSLLGPPESAVPGNQIRLIRRKGGDSRILGHNRSSSVRFEKDRWHLVAVTHDNHVINFYFDGVLVFSEKYEFDAQPVSADVIIGNSYLRTGLSEKYNGVIDEIAIFNRALLPSQIQELYRAGKP